MEQITTAGLEGYLVNSLATSMPLKPGISRSNTTTFGWQRRIHSRADLPSAAVATTSNSVPTRRQAWPRTPRCRRPQRCAVSFSYRTSQSPSILAAFRDGLSRLDTTLFYCFREDKTNTTLHVRSGTSSCFDDSPSLGGDL